MMKYFKLSVDLMLLATLCVSVTYWMIPWIQPSNRSFLPVRSSIVEPKQENAAVNVLFGRQAAALTMNGTYVLKGVLIAHNPSESIAILSVDNKPAEAIKTGMEISPGLVVQEVHRDHVLISQNGTILQLTLPIEKK